MSLAVISSGPIADERSTPQFEIPDTSRLPRPPFRPCRDSRTLVISWDIIELQGALDDEVFTITTTYNLLVSTNIFTSLSIEKYPSFPDIEWAEWGPGNTRILHEPMLSNPLGCCVYGNRFIGAAPIDLFSPNPRTSAIIAYDATPSAQHTWASSHLRKVDDRDVMITTRTMKRETPTTIADDLFEAYPVTSLPVCSTSRDGSFNGINGIMCDLEHIVILQVCSICLLYG